MKDTSVRMRSHTQKFDAATCMIPNRAIALWCLTFTYQINEKKTTKLTTASSKDLKKGPQEFRGSCITTQYSICTIQYNIAGGGGFLHAPRTLCRSNFYIKYDLLRTDLLRTFRDIPNRAYFM